MIIYIYALQFVDMDVENEKMYGCTMVVGPVTFVSFGGLSVHVGSTLASGTKKKNTICIHVHLSEGESIYDYIYMCVCVLGGRISTLLLVPKNDAPLAKVLSFGVGSISVATSSAAALPFSPC